MFRVVTVNNIPISKYSGLLLDYVYTPGAVISTLSSGAKKSIFQLFNQKSEKASLTISIAVKGRNRTETLRNKDSIYGLFSGLCEIRMDGYLFRFALASITEERKGLGIYVLTITGSASKHLPMITTTASRVYCQSQIPYTDCILKVTASHNALIYDLGPVRFNIVAQGDILTVDGINNQIKRGNVNYAKNCTFTKMPQLVPGYNDIVCEDTPQVSYYPTFY